MQFPLCVFLDNLTCSIEPIRHCSAVTIFYSFTYKSYAELVRFFLTFQKESEWAVKKWWILQTSIVIVCKKKKSLDQKSFTIKLAGKGLIQIQKSDKKGNCWIPESHFFASGSMVVDGFTQAIRWSQILPFVQDHDPSTKKSVISFSKKSRNRSQSLFLFLYFCYIMFVVCLLFSIAGICPWASSNGGAHGSQSDDSTYLARTWEICAVVFTSPLTSRLCSQLQELQELPTSSRRMWSSSKSISFYLPGLPDRELNPGPRVTKQMFYHWAIHTPLVISYFIYYMFI